MDAKKLYDYIVQLAEKHEVDPESIIIGVDTFGKYLEIEVLENNGYDGLEVTQRLESLKVERNPN